MPRIELFLPGEPKTQVEDVAEGYRITVERLDGIQCSPVEAQTAMSMFCFNALNPKKRQRGRKPLDPVAESGPP